MVECSTSFGAGTGRRQVCSRTNKTGGLLAQVLYREKCALGGLKEWSLITGGLNDRFDCM